jgi:hypothetical protein
MGPSPGEVQQALFRKVVLDAFVPDLMPPDRPFRPGLRVKRGDDQSS